MTTMLEMSPSPKFVKHRSGKLKFVELDARVYANLLIRANMTTPSLWPPGMRHGAKMFARIREIERRCIARHGEFDWEKMSRKLQDEYDILCSRLDQMTETESIPWEEVKASLYKRQRA